MSSRAQPNPIGRDVQNVVSEAQELLKTVKDEGAAQIDNARGKLAAQYDDVRNKVSAQYDVARQKFGEIQTQVTDTAKAAATTTDEYVRGNPWQAVGIATLAGAVIGYLCARR